jgi:hypothetical protein
MAPDSAMLAAADRVSLWIGGRRMRQPANVNSQPVRQTLFAMASRDRAPLYPELNPL